MAKKKMKSSDLEFNSLLRCDPEEGRLFFNGRRALLFDMGAMGVLRQQLIKTIGWELSMGVLSRFGYKHGHDDAEMLGKTFSWETESDWLAAGPAMHTLEGLVHVAARKMEFDRKTGHFHMHGVWRNSYEAETHLQLYGPSSKGPVCWTLTGYASGYASGFFGRDLLAIETECVGKGDARCYWEIRPVDQWGGAAAPYLNALKAIDLTEQLDDANRKLRESEARFRDIALSSSDRIWEMDAEGLYTYCSPGVGKILGYQAEELVGKRHFYDFFIPELRESLKNAWFETCSRKEIIGNFVTQNLHKDGSVVILETSGLPILERGKLAGYRGSDTDITMKIKHEEEKMAALRQLVGGVAHEMNNPVSVILGFAQGLRRHVHPGDPMALPLEHIERETFRCRDLVKDLLVFSRASPDDDRYDLDLNMAVESALGLLAPPIRSQGVELAKKLGPGLPKIVGDKNQIQQVIVNLCRNALDAMPRGGKLTITTERVSRHEADCIRIGLSDTGCGIPPENRAKVFEPFFTTKPAGQGTGLGLAVAYGIVQKHGGTIELQSEVGRGTTFYIYLPVAASGE